MTVPSWSTRNVGSQVARNPNHPVETLGMNAIATIAPYFGSVVNGHLDGISPHWSAYLTSPNIPTATPVPRAEDVMRVVSDQQHSVSGGTHDYWPAYYQLSQIMAKV